MKILMMTNTYTPMVGGLERSIQLFSEAFRARGHQVKVVAPEFEDQPEHERDVVRVRALEKFIGTNFSVTLPLPGIIVDLVEQYLPDIVHAHHPFLMGDLALRLCGQKKIPLVFTYHTMFEYYLGNFGLNSLALQQFVIELATGYANMVDQVIVPSASVAQLLKDRHVTTPIAVVPTGIDVDRFAPAPTGLRERLGIPRSAFVVGYTGRLSQEKNLTFLACGIAEFLRKNQEAHSLIVGGGTSEREMRKAFRVHEVQERVHFTGMLKGEALIEAYHAMDAFAFASKSETQGIVLTEAMAAGLPVVALDATGVREVVKDKQNGRLLEVESYQEFASALAWCASLKPSLWHQIKRTALETAREFSIETCAEKALQVYQSARLRREPYSAAQWQRLLGRFKAELELLLNFSRAAGSALVKSAVAEPTPKDKIFMRYQKQIERARRGWMRSLKKLRREMQGAPEETKVRFEAVAETLTQKIRAYEAELSDLNRKVLSACEAFEKSITEAHGEIKNELGKIHGEHVEDRI